MMVGREVMVGREDATCARGGLSLRAPRATLPASARSVVEAEADARVVAAAEVEAEAEEDPNVKVGAEGPALEGSLAAD